MSPAVDKDAVIVDDEEGEAVDLPSKEPASIPTIISVSTNVEATHPKPTEEKQGADDCDDNDDDVDFWRLK